MDVKIAQNLSKTLEFLIILQVPGCKARQCILCIGWYTFEREIVAEKKNLFYLRVVNQTCVPVSETQYVHLLGTSLCFNLQTVSLLLISVNPFPQPSSQICIKGQHLLLGTGQIINKYWVRHFQKSCIKGYRNSFCWDHKYTKLKLQESLKIITGVCFDQGFWQQPNPILSGFFSVSKASTPLHTKSHLNYHEL